MSKLEAAESVYLKQYKATPAELKALGFESADISMEYVKERVLETMAEAYVESMSSVEQLRTLG